jgi:uncharacterized protein YbbC (DUF1343 family)
MRGQVDDNVSDTVDEKTGLPIHSLYGDTRRPTDAMLEGIDTIVIDLQDIGARFYTYISTLGLTMEAAAESNKKFFVLDRVNPIGGTIIEGPVREGEGTFVAWHTINIRHGMTVGELARLFNEEFGIGASLEVVKMDGWSRESYWDSTGLPWVMPSPNIPTVDSTVVFPGTVLFEGTMLSEGRGTTRPFELVGAPWIDAEAFAASMNALALPGAHFRPAVFEPTFQKHAKQPCGGCQIHVLDRNAFRPVLTGVALIDQFRRANRSSFAWRQPPYEYEHEKMPFDILSGSDTLRRQLESEVPLAEIAESWREDERAFEKQRKRYLLY